MGNNQEIKIYQSADGVKLDVKLEGNTMWLTQQQIAELFESSRTNTVEHIQNVYSEEELDEKATCRNFRQARKEGNRTVERELPFYNLDMIISVGYRVKSKTATQFRIWATNILKQHITQGYTVNQKRLDELNFALNVLERSSTPEISGISALISDYTQALFLLDSYDRKELPEVSGTEDSWQLTYEEARSVLENLPDYAKSEMFAKERTGQFKGVLEQIYSGFGDREYYPSIEKKAANLLYFIVKDHSFYDGNKRSEAA